ncbi:MAG: DDE-type integrase/transposase/recombinase [Cupriavidus sp.]|nr:transposase [Cupriavidus sp.]MCA3194058.1 DDE-type integrase/transposase/recombinase [Cupriavidus sp.]MCA3200302.1 DDE-type integrase/transposase/recombinase [Cupriavidus sp.]MCA3235631.1 DDE-type integrase/transposase/recombinase [Cupriavidus sp.]
MDTFEDLPLLVDNQLVRARGYPDDPLYRIAWTGNGSLYTYLVRIDGADNWIWALPTRTLQDRLAPNYAQTDALQLVSDDEDPYARASHADPSERALKRYALIKDLVDGENRLRILAGVGTTALYEACAKRAGTTRQTIAIWVKRYLTRGMCADALSGDWQKCGAPGRRRDAITKVGRSRKHDPCGRRSGTQVNQRGRAILSAGYCFAKVNGYNYSQFKAYIDNKYCRDWAPENRFTIGQIRYYVRKNEPPVERRIRLHGARHYTLVDRPYDGQSSASGPGAEYQIDSTVGDVYLVSAMDRLRVVGRPTIYLVTDTYSRLIVGIYVGFESPSFLGAALTMESVVTPKVELCRRYGLSIEEWWWPSHHLGRRMMHDRGREFMSWLAWRRLNVRYGVDCDNPPPFRPDWKAIVESRFGILNKEWGPYVPGHVEKDYRKRGSHNYLLDATMTLREFTKLMLLMVVRYNIRPFDRIPKDPTFVGQGLADSPVELWRYGIEHYSGTLRTVPVEAMRACVYPRVAARVTREGIALGNRFYETERANREQWFVRARSEGTYGVDLHDSIYAKPVGPPRIGLRFRCVSPIAHHGPDHWVSKYQRCRNDRAFVNVNCKCGFSFKVHRSLSRCEITRADIARINRYGEGYRAYIRQRIDDAASISQIAKELGIGKGVVIQLSRRKPLPAMQRYATGASLPTASTSHKSSR